ncbi:MAG: HemK2/MTQ2 family protein methyltransferase [Candidatus Altiarchaeota archaeon]|nr:HemK2/MTQ2 family protein methyltransferase [Candidatus Altiarchaeota archaeon]
MRFMGLEFQMHPEVYEPAEDSMLLADNLGVWGGDLVLDMGTGTGFLALLAAIKAKKVLGVDVNPVAIDVARENALLNNIENAEFRVSDLFSDLEGEVFDLIIFNPPYLPVDEMDMLDRSWSGGSKGLEVIKRFLKSAPDYLKEGGGIRLLVSSLNDLDELRKILNENNFGFEILAKKKLWFEEIYVIKAVKR